jgi:F-type H+-transporting ATPase subunit a
MSFTWTSLIPGVGHELAHVATAGIIAGGLILVGVKARASLGAGDEAAVPASKFSIRGLIELVVEFIAGLADMIIGDDGRKYVPFFATLFTFILVNNLMGVIPGVAPATENINLTFAMGCFSFICYNFFGLRANGLSYLKHFLGPFLPLAFIMLPIELVSNFIRPFSLSMRLANVMMGDHTVLGVFLGLVPIGIPIPFYLLGIFVCFVQAFVFTLLSMVYVSLATAHEH